MSARSPEEMVVDWEKTMNSGDIEGVLAFYEPEAVVVLPKDQGGPVRGQDAVRAVLGQFLAMDPTFNIVLHRATDAGSVALIVGDWNLTGTGPDAALVEMAGRFRDVLSQLPSG